MLEEYGATLDATGQDYLGRVRAAAQRMARLIDDMLGLARMARAEMNLGEVDLTALAHAVLADLGQHDPGRVVKLDVAEGLRARGDERLLRVVLGNLLANAWKFTANAAHARIEIGVAPADRGVAYYVRDNGAGFDMAHADKLFVPFQRLHATADYPGSGIGLATVQRIVRRHGGRVWAHGEIGRGATFWFTLPEGGGTA